MGTNRTGMVATAAACAIFLVSSWWSLKSKKKDFSVEEDFVGLRLFYFPRSPCARRIWLLLKLKKIKFEAVLVDLMKGEQRSASYLRLNPQGKVPVLVHRVAKGEPLQIIYESSAIAAYIEAQFGNKEIDLKTEQWMQFELSLAEVVWPLSRDQIDGVVWRFLKSYNLSTMKQDYYRAKLAVIYNAKHSFASRRHRARRILQAAKMVDLALSSSNTTYLLSKDLSYADFCVYGRLIKCPQNGLLIKPKDVFPRLTTYLESIMKEPVVDMWGSTIWFSNGRPTFLARDIGFFFAHVMTWDMLIRIGNWRAGSLNFQRVTQNDIDVKAAVHQVETLPLQAIPKTFTLHPKPQFHYDSCHTLCAALLSLIQHDSIDFIRVDTARLQHELDPYIRQLTPLGELPVLTTTRGDTYYGATVVLRALGEDNIGVHERQVIGWARTAWFYQIAPLKRMTLDIPLLATVCQNGDPISYLLKLWDLDETLDENVDACADFCQGDTSDNALLLHGLATELYTNRLDTAIQFVSSAPPSAITNAFVLPVVALACVYADKLLQDGKSTTNWLDLLTFRSPELSVWARSALAANECLKAAINDLVLTHTSTTSIPSRLGRDGPRGTIIRSVPHPPFMREVVIDHLQENFKVEPADIYIVTYPKCGTTWMQQIVLLLLYNGDASKVEPHPKIQSCAPWLEACYCRTARFGGPCPYLDAHLKFPRHNGRRVFKTHAPEELSIFRNKPNRGKTIYVARNAKDTCCSLYSHTTTLPPYEYKESIDHFVPLFAQGQVEHGSWYSHHVNWFNKAQNDDKILYIHFEFLKTDPKKAITRIAHFLGLDPTDQLIDLVVHHSSFSAMKQRTAASSASTALYQSSSQTDFATSRFRSGAIGKWHINNGGLLSDAHSAMIDAALLNDLPPGLLYEDTVMEREHVKDNEDTVVDTVV